MSYQRMDTNPLTQKKIIDTTLMFLASVLERKGTQSVSDAEQMIKDRYLELLVAEGMPESYLRQAVECGASINWEDYIRSETLAVGASAPLERRCEAVRFLTQNGFPIDNSIFAESVEAWSCEAYCLIFGPDTREIIPLLENSSGPLPLEICLELMGRLWEGEKIDRPPVAIARILASTVRSETLRSWVEERLASLVKTCPPFIDFVSPNVSDPESVERQGSGRDKSGGSDFSSMAEYKEYRARNLKALKIRVETERRIQKVREELEPVHYLTLVLDQMQQMTYLETGEPIRWSRNPLAILLDRVLHLPDVQELSTNEKFLTITFDLTPEKKLFQLLDEVIHG